MVFRSWKVAQAASALSDNQTLCFGTRVPFCILPFGPLSMTFYRDSSYRSLGTSTVVCDQELSLKSSAHEGFISIESLVFPDMQLRCIRVFARTPGFADLGSLNLLLEDAGCGSALMLVGWTQKDQSIGKGCRFRERSKELSAFSVLANYEEIY
jgi:hypothetical protein